MLIPNSTSSARRIVRRDDTPPPISSHAGDYAVRALARRARISLPYAALVAELAGLLKEEAHG